VYCPGLDGVVGKSSWLQGIVVVVIVGGSMGETTVSLSLPLLSGEGEQDDHCHQRRQRGTMTMAVVAYYLCGVVVKKIVCADALQQKRRSQPTRKYILYTNGN
jgi:hypothetical protein